MIGKNEKGQQIFCKQNVLQNESNLLKLYESYTNDKNVIFN